MKRCTKCGEVKEESEFYKRKEGAGGLHSQCKMCCARKQREWKAKNIIERKTARRARYKENPGHFREKTRLWRKSNPEKVLEIARKSNAKVDRFEAALSSSRRAAKAGGYEPCNASLEEIKVAFTGRCVVCGVLELECGSKFHMDHNHENGEFRGWLCGSCNKGLGFFKDSEELLINALHHLMNYKAKA